jgi:hypothetical protein
MSTQVYGARLDLVNFDSRFCVPVALRRHEANLESLRMRAMRWSAKDAQQNSPKMTARRI